MRGEYIVTPPQTTLDVQPIVLWIQACCHSPPAWILIYTLKEHFALLKQRPQFS